MPTDVLYVKCCILTSQIPDTTNDILQRKDIKKKNIHQHKKPELRHRTPKENT